MNFGWSERNFRQVAREAHDSYMDPSVAGLANDLLTKRASILRKPWENLLLTIDVILGICMTGAIVAVMYLTVR